MAKRRPNGEGMVRQLDNGQWEGRIVVGHKKDGRCIFRQAYAKTQKELIRKLHQRIELYRDAELTEDSNMTLGEWLDRWIEEFVPGTVRESTLEGYRTQMDNYVKPYFGGKSISRITSADLQKLYLTLLKEGRIHPGKDGDTTLSTGTVNHVHNTLHLALEAAIQEHLIVKNPCDGTAPPKPEKAPLQVLNDAQLERFMRIIREDERWYDFFYTEITTGLRRGEICGLQWQDFDSEHGELHVQRTLHFRLGLYTVGETKTGKGKRIIVLPASTARLLREREKTAISQWIFPNLILPELPISASAAYHRLKEILKEGELPDIRFHDLRHTFATHALASGVDDKTLAGILGHTNASFTLDTYTHVTGDMQKSAAKVVGNYIEDIFGEDFDLCQENPSGESPDKAPSTCAKMGDGKAAM